MKHIFKLMILTGMACSSIAFGKTIPTEINTVTPKFDHLKTRGGECWVDSIASNRPDAWRCKVGNFIFDPCFATSKEGFLLCDYNPPAHKEGFLLHLTKPLPAPTSMKTTQVIPWLLQLADGSICQKYTGTTPNTDKGAIPYYCVEKMKLPKNCDSGLIEDSIKEGETWTVMKATYCSGEKVYPLKTKEVRTVDVLKVWQ